MEKMAFRPAFYIALYFLNLGMLCLVIVHPEGSAFPPLVSGGFAVLGMVPGLFAIHSRIKVDVNGYFTLSSCILLCGLLGLIVFSPFQRLSSFLFCFLGISVVLRSECRRLNPSRNLETQKTASNPTPEGKKEVVEEPDKPVSEPAPYTWAEYMADIERGMSVDEMRDKLAGRAVPRRPVGGPPPTPDDEDEDDSPYESKGKCLVCGEPARYSPFHPYCLKHEPEDPSCSDCGVALKPGVHWPSCSIVRSSIPIPPPTISCKFCGKTIPFLPWKDDYCDPCTPDPNAFSKTCYLCGRGLSSDRGDYCRSCRAIRLRAPKLAAEMRRQQHLKREHALLDGLPVPVKCKCGVPLPGGGSHCSVACFQQSLKPKDPEVEKTEKCDCIFRRRYDVPDGVSFGAVPFCVPYSNTFEFTGLDIIFQSDLVDGVLNVLMGELNVEVVADNRVVLPRVPFSMFEKQGPGHGRWTFRNPFTTTPTGVIKVNLIVDRPLPRSCCLEVLASGTLERPKN